MMGPFLGVTLVPQAEVRNVMVPIFHDMMDWEQRKNGNFKQVRYQMTKFVSFQTLSSVSINVQEIMWKNLKKWNAFFN